MRSAMVVTSNFDADWPWAADHFHELWTKDGPVDFVRVKPGDARSLHELVPEPRTVERLVSLGVPFTAASAHAFSNLREAAVEHTPPSEPLQKLKQAGLRVYKHPTEGFWGPSVSEFGLALTLCGLRRIPQTHHDILTNQSPWDYSPSGGVGLPGTRGHQYGDDSRFTSGTLDRKRVRIVGAGNIASRYASFAHFMGADVAAWDPFAGEPAFHRAGTRREWHLDRLVSDAEIFVPMVPLTDSTKGVVTAAHINALPKGCLVVMVTRALICDVPTLRRRVLADELALAADVFDVEPLPLDDPLLGRHNVVHTPHNAGRTRDANHFWAEKLAEQFLPVRNAVND
jgi:phosphoglycerate dehydrogenase-like enzyme